MFTYYIGSIKIECDDINSLKDFVVNISNSVKEEVELPNYISDFVYGVESDYQQFHDLDQDDWGSVHKK